jgi:hypothetical protein
VSETRVVLKHGLRNAMIPVVTMMGLQFGFRSAGRSWRRCLTGRGLGAAGRFGGDARLPVIQAEVLLFSLEFILINLVVDVLRGHKPGYQVSKVRLLNWRRQAALNAMPGIRPGEIHTPGMSSGGAFVASRWRWALVFSCCC